MAHLVKRGKYYHIRWRKTVDGTQESAQFTLNTRYKTIANQLLTELEKLESLGKIDPYSPGFNPLTVLKKDSNNLGCNTMRDALNIFLDSKKHLSAKTIEAYEWAIEHFIDANDLENVHPKNVYQEHFEAIIFKSGIKETTRHYYYRHFRAFWNYLLNKKIVEVDYFKDIRSRIPKIRENTRPKMITKKELEKLFKTFDDELERKKKRKDFDSEKVQYWFKPIICLYIYAGLRKHEAAYDSELPYSGLKGMNLVFEDGELTYIYLPPTKGRKEREIPMINELKKVMNEYLSKRGHVSRNDYVFRYFGGRWKGRPVSGQVVYKEFKRYADEAKIPGTRSLHGMRHRAVTTWIEAGFSTAEAAFLSGHSSQRVTEKYTHLTSKGLKEKMDKL